MERFSRNALTRAVIGAVAVSTLTLAAVPATAQVPTSIFNNVSNLNAAGDGAGNYVYSEVYTDLGRGGFSGSAGSWTLSPNTGYYEDVCFGADPDGLAFWCQGSGDTGSGNKWIQAIMTSDEAVPIGPGGTYTFTACSDTSGLSAPYVVTESFIKVLTDGAANGDNIYNVIGEVYGAGSGSTDLSIEVLGDINVIVQKGFTFEGPNANPATAGDAGAASVSVGATCPSGGGGSGAYDPTAVPVLPIWGMVLLTGIMGLFGARAAGRKRK